MTSLDPDLPYSWEIHWMRGRYRLPPIDFLPLSPHFFSHPNDIVTISGNISQRRCLTHSENLDTVSQYLVKFNLCLVVTTICNFSNIVSILTNVFLIPEQSKGETLEGAVKIILLCFFHRFVKFLTVGTASTNVNSTRHIKGGSWLGLCRGWIFISDFTEPKTRYVSQLFVRDPSQMGYLNVILCLYI